MFSPATSVFTPFVLTLDCEAFVLAFVLHLLFYCYYVSGISDSISIPTCMLRFWRYSHNCWCFYLFLSGQFHGGRLFLLLFIFSDLDLVHLCSCFIALFPWKLKRSNIISMANQRVNKRLFVLTISSIAL